MQDQNNVFKPNVLALTPAQKELINFCSHLDAPDLVKSINATLNLALFNDGGDLDKDDRAHVYRTKILLEKIEAVQAEGKKPLLSVIP